MNEVLIWLASVLLATNQPAAISNFLRTTTGISVAIPEPNDPVEKEYRKLLEFEKQVLAQLDKSVREKQTPTQQSGGVSSLPNLRQRIETELAPVRNAYEDFIRRNPNHAAARISYGNFLNDTGDEDGAVAQWEKVLQLDPANSAAWNNLANYYGHRGPVEKAFAFYAKAIELNPREPVFYYNLGTTVYLFRKDAMQFYGITEQQVFDMALDLYNKALQLDPNNFTLAADIAQTYYGIRPMRTDAAIKAWEYALKLAPNELARQNVYLHLARLKINARRIDEAKQHLDAVTNSTYDVVKARLLRRLNEELAKQPVSNTITNNSNEEAKKQSEKAITSN